MSQPKEVPLNGAYYGPSIPSQQPYQRPRRRGCCVLTTLIGIIVVLGIAALVSWLIIRPREMKFYVVSTDLKQFNLTNGDTLNYDLSVDMSIRNPNRRMGVYYDRIDATASYKGERFAWKSLPVRFYQGHKNTTDLNVHLQGLQFIRLNSNEVDRFDQERASGYFDIEVKLFLRIRFKIGSIKTRRMKPDVECRRLRIPLASSNGTTVSNRFQTKRCDLDF